MSQRSSVQAGESVLGDRALAAGGLAFELAKKWWVLLLRGILLIVIGLLGFVSPLTWVIFVGIYMLIDGITMLMSGFSDQPAGQSRWPLVILGVLGLLAGLIVLWDPELGAITFTIIVAAWAGNVLFAATVIPVALGADSLRGASIGMCLGLFAVSLVVWTWAFVIALARTARCLSIGRSDHGGRPISHSGGTISVMIRCCTMCALNR